MTATNIIVQSSAAHLLTDAAFYDPDGVVRRLAPKIVLHERFRMGIAVAQRATVERVAPWLDEQPDQETALRSLPALVETIKHENLQEATGPGDLNDVALFAVLWSDTRDRAEGWIVATHRAYFGDEYEPGTLVEVETLLSPQIDPAAVLRHGGRFPARFEAVGDGRRILEAQRRSSEHTHGQHLVGGWGCLATVRRAGISHRVICEWPQDAVGQRIAA